MNSVFAVDSAMPLCCRYFSAHFDEQPIQIFAGGAATRELRVVWGLGVLHDRDWGVLGAWPVLSGGVAFWRGLFDQLKARGVEEHIPLLLTHAPADVGAAFSGAAVLPSFGRMMNRRHAPLVSKSGLLDAVARREVREASSVRSARARLERLSPVLEIGKAAVLAADWSDLLPQFEAFYALRPSRRTGIRLGDEYLEQVGRALSRAVGRHGPFSDLFAATSFVTETLTRVEAQIKSSLALDLPMPAHLTGRAATRNLVAAESRASTQAG